VTVKAVIFDFGGVFTTSPVENFAIFEKKHGLPERFIGGVIKANHHTNAWARYERAEIGIAEFDSLFAAETKAAGFEIAGRTLVGLLALTFRPEMIEALGRVKSAGFKTGCITNNLPELDNAAMLAAGDAREHVRAIYANFDHIIESSKAGVRKPELRIYEMMCEVLTVAPEECVFLDDLGINLKPAREMGMTTIKVPYGDVTPAIAELEAIIGVKLT
jgi:putative hydrolase of the HAD superfamily